MIKTLIIGESPVTSRPTTISPLPSPPPLLPPKTRKLHQLSSSTAATNQSETGSGNLHQSATSIHPGQTGWDQSAAGIPTPGQAALHHNNNTQKSGNNLNSSGPSRTSKVKIDPLSESVTSSVGPSGLGRSISSVGHGHIVRKPVRRSKSHLNGSKYIANIQHGGLVTLVSLRKNKITFQVVKITFFSAIFKAGNYYLVS